MDLSKLAAAALTQSRPAGPLSDQPAHTAAELPLSVPAPASTDRAEIRPLDIPGALQILIAEVQLALTTVLEAALAATQDATHDATRDAARTAASLPLAVTENAAQAAQVVVEMLLQAIPEPAGEPPDRAAVAVWAAAAAQVEAAVQQGFDEALRTVSNWRAVPPSVLEAPRDARWLTAAVLADEIQNPLWLRPEWVGLAPRLARYVRRRRYARRRLSDPDYSRGLDDADWG